MISILNVHLLQFLLVSFTMGFPVEDTQLVGSSLHGVTAKPPTDLLAAGDSSGYHYGGDDGDDGYVHTHANKGDDGYKKYDTFHKKDGDSYGYEKHTSFGNADGDGKDGEYHETSSYSDGDEGYGTSSKPKFTAYHYETSSGTPKDYSNYNPEAEDDGDDESTNVKPVSLTPAESRRVHKDVEVTAPLKGAKFQSLLDVSGENPLPKRKSIKKRSKNKDSKPSGTEGDGYYEGDSYYYEGDEGGDAEGDEGDEAEYEGSYYEGEGGENSSYHPEAEGSSEFY